MLWDPRCGFLNLQRERVCSGSCDHVKQQQQALQGGGRRGTQDHTMVIKVSVCLWRFPSGDERVLNEGKHSGMHKEGVQCGLNSHSLKS